MAGEILTELNRIDGNIDAAFEKCRALGATMPQVQNSDYLADTIESIPSASDIPVKTASDMTASGATVTAPAGWYKSAASKSVATATQATPSISVSSGGLITASATQSAGYVVAGTKSGTKQLTTQAAKTVTPTKSERTAVAAGVFTTGAVKVAKIPDSYIQPSGTKSITTNGTHDVTSFASVEVNVAGSGGGGGGAVETCTVRLNSNSGNIGGSFNVFYTSNANTWIRFYFVMLFNTDITFTVAKNTPFIIFGGGSYDFDVSANLVNIADDEDNVYAAYKVLGNATITYVG